MYSVFVDRERHTFLQYRDTGKVKHYVSMISGSIDLIQLTPTEQRELQRCLSTPEQFAKIYLNSTLDISRGARAILRAVLGDNPGPEVIPSSPSFSSGTVALEEIAEVNNWDPSRCRKHLRKLINKPGGRWAWTPEEAEKVTTILKECFDSEV